MLEVAVHFWRRLEKTLHGFALPMSAKYILSVAVEWDYNGCHEQDFRKLGGGKLLIVSNYL